MTSVFQQFFTRIWLKLTELVEASTEIPKTDFADRLLLCASIAALALAIFGASQPAAAAVAADVNTPIDSATKPAAGPSDEQITPTNQSRDAAAGLREERDRRAERQQRSVDRLEFTYQVLNIIDGVQTISCMQKPNCHEANPLLGRRPSTSTVIGFKAGMGLAHYLLYRLISRDPKLALRFEIGTVIFQGGAVGLNFRHSF